METSSLTARQLFENAKANPTRRKFGFGRKPMLVNIDLQCAYTAVGEFATAYETDPQQLEYVNTLSELARAKSLPITWTYVAYMNPAKIVASGARARIRPTRCKTSRSARDARNSIRG